MTRQKEELLNEVFTMTEPILELEFEKAERYKRELKKQTEQTQQYKKQLAENEKRYQKEIAELQRQIEELKQEKRK